MTYKSFFCVWFIFYYFFLDAVDQEVDLIHQDLKTVIEEGIEMIENEIDAGKYLNVIFVNKIISFNFVFNRSNNNLVYTSYLQKQMCHSTGGRCYLKMYLNLTPCGTSFIDMWRFLGADANPF